MKMKVDIKKTNENLVWITVSVDDKMFRSENVHKDNPVVAIWKEIALRFNRDKEVEYSYKMYDAIETLYKPKPVTVGDLKPGIDNKFTIPSGVKFHNNLENEHTEFMRIDGDYRTSEEPGDMAIVNIKTGQKIQLPKDTPCERVEDE